MNPSIDIRERMPVYGSCGSHVGMVDQVEGQTIKLTRTGGNANGQHHWIPLSWVTGVDDAVRLNRTADEATRDWSARPLGGR
jgi:hypothetical protein